MPAIDDGGPAFPQGETRDICGKIHFAHPGMTLRQWYAGQALAARRGQDRDASSKLIATFSLDDADALIAHEAATRAASAEPAT